MKLTYCKGSTPGACNSNRLMDVALCKPVDDWILCIHTHRKQGAWLPHTSIHQSMATKVGVAHEECMSASLHLHITYSLILHCTWSILGQPQIIFKAGLIQMTRPSFSTALYIIMWSDKWDKHFNKCSEISQCGWKLACGRL